MKHYGHILDLAEHVADDLEKRHIRDLIGVAPYIANVDRRSIVGPRPDQQATSTCTGWAFKGAIDATATLQGLTLGVSAKALYDVGRLLDAPRAPLADIGARPRAVIIGASDYGLVAESRWPLAFAPDGSSPNVDTAPPLDVFLHGMSAKLGSYYRIPSGPGAAEAVRLALVRGYFPAFAMNVTEKYEQLGASHDPYDGDDGPVLGGHMQFFCGSDNGFLWVAGSWGPTFADAGFVRVTDHFVDTRATDLLVVTVVPLEVS